MGSVTYVAQTLGVLLNHYSHPVAEMVGDQPKRVLTKRNLRRRPNHAFTSATLSGSGLRGAETNLR